LRSALNLPPAGVLGAAEEHSQLAEGLHFGVKLEDRAGLRLDLMAHWPTFVAYDLDNCAGL
jgi:hypothetical protein